MHITGTPLERLEYFFWKAPTGMLEVLVAIHFLIVGIFNVNPIFGAIEVVVASALLFGMFCMRRACKWYAVLFVVLAVLSGCEAGHKYYTDASLKSICISTFWVVFSCVPAIRALLRSDRFRERRAWIGNDRGAF
jgi:hypothetical protein